MEYVKKKFVDEENRVISWFSTDDNVLCSDGRLLREKLIELGENFSSGYSCNITDASNIKIEDVNNNFTSTNVEGALEEVINKLKLTISDNTIKLMFGTKELSSITINS